MPPIAVADGCGRLPMIFDTPLLLRCRHFLRRFEYFSAITLPPPVPITPAFEISFLLDAAFARGFITPLIL